MINSIWLRSIVILYYKKVTSLPKLIACSIKSYPNVKNFYFSDTSESGYDNKVAVDDALPSPSSPSIKMEEIEESVTSFP